MSYIPTEWKTGDIVTADKLNKLEEGVASGGGGGGGGGALIVELHDEEIEGTAYSVMNKTAGEIIENMPLVFVDDSRIEGDFQQHTFDRISVYIGLPAGAELPAGYYFSKDMSAPPSSAYYAATLSDYPKCDIST